MLGMLRRVIYGAGVVYAISLPFSFFLGAGMLAKPGRKSYSVDQLRDALPDGASLEFLADAREVKIQVAEREQWSATVVSGGGRGTILLLHEFGTNRCSVVGPAYALWNEGFDVVLLDRRAHGTSEGDSRPLFGGESDGLEIVVDQLIAEGWTMTRSIGMFGIRDAGTSCLAAAALDPRVQAVAALDSCIDARDLVAADIAHWWKVPTPLVVPQSFVAMLGAGLIAGIDQREFDARPTLRRLQAPALLLYDDAPGAERRTRTVQAASGGTPELERLPVETTELDRWAGLVDFFRRNL